MRLLEGEEVKVVGSRNQYFRTTTKGRLLEISSPFGRMILNLRLARMLHDSLGALIASAKEGSRD